MALLNEVSEIATLEKSEEDAKRAYNKDPYELKEEEQEEEDDDKPDKARLSLLQTFKKKQISPTFLKILHKHYPKFVCTSSDIQCLRKIFNEEMESFSYKDKEAFRTTPATLRVERIFVFSPFDRDPISA